MTYQKTLAVLLQVVVFCLYANVSSLIASASDAQLISSPEKSGSIAFAAQVSAEAPTQPAISVPPASQDSIASEIVSLTNQLLLKEIDFERFYLQYRVIGSKEPKYRRLRFFMLQQASGSGALGVNIVNVAELGSHLGTPQETSNAVMKGSSRLGLASAIVGGTASTIELASNGGIALKNKLNKTDPETFRRHAILRLQEIDQLSARRDALIRGLKESAARDIFVQEGLLLRTFRSWCIYEFVDVYADIKSYQASTNVFYVIDIAAYATSYASYLVTLRAFTNPQRGSLAVHNGLVSDTFFTGEAPSTTAAYKWLYNMAWNNLSKELKENPKDVETDAKVQMFKLERLAALADDSALAAVGHISSRLAVYSFWSTRYDKYIDKRLGDMRRLSRIALQSNLSGPLLGVAGISQDIMNEFGVYRYKRNPFRQNALAFAGSATGVMASTVSVGLTGWWFADELKHQRDSTQANLLPQQLMQDRVRTLGILEQMLGNPK